jgi:hypothetical protein
MSSFATLTLQAAQGLLAARLSDAAMLRWTAPELQSYLTEALRTWQALTGSTKTSAAFTATSSVTFYDLPTVFPTQRGYNVLTTSLLSDLEYALLEPITPAGWASWTGTPQFTLLDLITAVQQRRDRFLSETRAVMTHSLLPLAPPPPSGRFPLADGTLAIQRLAWQDGLSGKVSPLCRDDEWGLTSYARSWPQNAGVPFVYSVSSAPPLVVQLAPPPLATGIVDAIMVLAGAPVNPTLVTQTLGMPDDWTWVVKFGALADLLSTDGLSLDADRATYCTARWNQGMALAKAAAVVLTAKINAQPCLIDLIVHADQYAASWQATPGTPQQVLLAGQNLLAISPPVSSGNWSVEVDLIPNMPIPVLGTDYLQVSLDTFDLILDYAQHLALFKEGYGPLVGSQGLLERFLKAAGVSTDRRTPWKPNRGVPEPTLPDEAWAAGTTSDPVGVS